MKIAVDEKNRILSVNSYRENDKVVSGECRVEGHNLLDIFNRPQYIWEGGQAIYSPQPYTPEQLETSRKDTCREEIRKLYSIEDELKILRKAVQSTEPDYVQYNLAVENIITTSKEYKLIPEEKAPKEIINDPIKTS